MKINNQAQEMSLEFSGIGMESTASRRRSDTSDPIGNSTGETNLGTPEATSAGRLADAEFASDVIDVSGAVEKLNEIAQSKRTNVSFSVDKEANATVIRVFRTETGELIRQFPPDEILALKEKINGSVGMFYDAKA